MKVSKSTIGSGTFLLRVAGILAVCVLIPLLTFATAPTWWLQRGVLVPNAQSDDYAAANQGQLKNIAKGAVDEMDVRLPGGAGTVLHDLVNVWGTPNSQTNDFAPVNLGQLKNVAKPFYNRLTAVGLASEYPWAGNSNGPDDFAIANIGQVKKLFSFDLLDAVAAPPMGLIAVATSPTTVVLSWVPGSAFATTTIQASVDGGITWFTVGVTGPGINTATITGLTPGTNVMFAVSSGGAYIPGGGNNFAGPAPNATGGGSLPSGATVPAEVTPLGQPVIEGEESSYNLGAWGFAGFMMSHISYLTETAVFALRVTNRLTGDIEEGTRTLVYRIDPLTASQSVEQPVITGIGAPGFHFGEPSTEQQIISDTVLFTESLPGDMDDFGSPVYQTLTVTLSDPNDEPTLRVNADGQIPAFQNRFRERREFADIYVNRSGYEITRLQYRWQVNADPDLVVTWDVQFTSYEDDHIEHEIHHWASNGATRSPTYLIDPRYERGGANGYYDVILLAAEPMVDGNRDGQMNFNDPVIHDDDKTTSDKPYRFWLNDDEDTEQNPDGPGGSPGTPKETETVPASRPDYSLRQIVSKRNLEDFSRLWIDMSGARDALSWDMQVGLKWKNATGAPKINIYPSEDGDGSTDYLTTDPSAARQIVDDFGNAVTDKNNRNTVDTSGTFIFKADYWDGLTDENPKKCLLFEGAGEGKGELTVVILDQDGHELAEVGSVWLELKNIKRMYQRQDISDQNQWPSATFEADPNETNQAIVFVHGWNTSPDGASSFGETMFKRLWQRGFKGRYAAIRWNTDWSSTFNNVPLIGQTIDAYLADYNDSEHQAWLSGEALKSFVASFTGFSKNVIAHSMGNIVVASALRRGMVVDNYALLHGAVPASCYDAASYLQQPQAPGAFGYMYWDVRSPDDDPGPLTSALAYRGRLNMVPGNLVNFCLQGDRATTYAWEFNNRVFKPHSGFFYNRNEVDGSRLWKNEFGIRRSLTDPEEAMPYADQSWSKVVGAESRTAGAISSTVNLESPAYSLPGDTGGFNDDHSAEFSRNIQQLQPFYRELLRQLRVSQNQ